MIYSLTRAENVKSVERHISETMDTIHIDRIVNRGDSVFHFGGVV